MLAEFERTLIVQRTRDGVRSKMLNNNKIHGGRLLLGFDQKKGTTGEWEPNQDELKRVERLLDLIPSYDGYPSFCKAAKVDGLKSKYGNPITKDTIRRMVFSKKYEGINEIHVAVSPPTEKLKTPRREKIAERPLGFGVVVDLDKLERARAKLREWDGNGNSTKTSKRVYILSKILQTEDGTPMTATCGTSRCGQKIYYYTNNKKVSVRAEDIETEVIKAIGCYINEEEIQGYVQEAVKQFTANIELIDGQIASQRMELKKLKKREADLAKALDGMPAETERNEMGQPWNLPP